MRTWLMVIRIRIEVSGCAGFFQREADHPAGIEVLFLTHSHSIEWFLRTFFKGRSLQLPRLVAVRVICPE